MQQAHGLPMSHAANVRPQPQPREPARRDLAWDEQKRSFLRMVSHELRTPLNSILGFSEILTSELYGPLGAPQYKEYAEIIRGSGQKLLNLVNQVLEIAKLEAHAIEFEAGPEPIEAALDDVLATLKPALAERNVSVSVREGDLPAALADARGLRTVLFNLIENAVVFSPEGGAVTIDAQRCQDEVEIVIANPGEGVDPEELPRLMTPFAQGQNALTRQSDGAGLGLPISELTCRAMGGRLRLSSQPGQGLTARVRLPAA